MKKTLIKTTCTLVASAATCVLLASAAMAEDVATSITTSSGTLTEYTPGSAFVVKETSGPVTYRYGKNVTYVTKSGKTLSDEEVTTRVKVNTPVSVGYITEGENRVINRVEIDD